MALNGVAHEFISASVPSTVRSVDDILERPKGVFNSLGDRRRDRLPTGFLGRHQAALALDPTADANLLVGLQSDYYGQQISLQRPIYTQRQIDERYEFEQDKQDFDLVELTERLKTKCYCSKQRLINIVKSHMPIFEILHNYNYKEMLLIDVLCGLTIGLINMAHGMTNALLANVLPTVGLYTSFYPVWLYTLFGTSKTMGYGTMSITSILVGNAVLDIAAKQTPKGDWIVNNQTFTYDQHRMHVQSELAICITFLSGLFQLFGGLLNLGFLTVYFADAMVTGFTTATMIYVVTSQAKYVLGLRFQKPTGMGNIFATWAKIFESLPQTNWVAVSLSTVSAVVLLFFKYWINPKLLRKIRAPFPIEAVLMIAATILSSQLDLEKNHDIDCLGSMANGLPMPKVPDMEYMDDVIGTSVLAGIINFAVTVSLAEVLARRNNSEIDPNQECFAYGICNFISSFFLCMPSGGGVSRSYIQDSMRPKTQIVGFVQSIVLLAVLLWIATFFSTLPQCVLAIIVLVALSAIGEQLMEAWRLWWIAKVDCIIWLFSFLVTTALDIQIGLVLSILFSLITVVVRGQFAESHILGNIPGTDIYRNVAAYKHAQEFGRIKIFRFCGEIHFACANHFRTVLYKKCGVNPRKVVADKEMEDHLALLQSTEEDIGAQALKFLIVDLSMCCFIDYGGLRILKQVIEEYRAIDVIVILAACPEPLQRSLIRAGFYETHDEDLVYVSVHDAVTYAKSIVNNLETS